MGWAEAKTWHCSSILKGRLAGATIVDTFDYHTKKDFLILSNALFGRDGADEA
jgi:hypothetical protein